MREDEEATPRTLTSHLGLIKSEIGQHHVDALRSYTPHKVGSRWALPPKTPRTCFEFLASQASITGGPVVPFRVLAAKGITKWKGCWARLLKFNLYADEIGKRWHAWPEAPQDPRSFYL
jgi:hypothetical protein